MVIFNNLLIAFQTKVLTDIPEIRLVDQDLNQIDGGTRPPLTSGGNLYVDFIATTYIQRQLKVQLAEMDILLRLAFDPYSQSNSLAPEEVRVKALQYFDIEHKLYLCLHDWNAEGLLTLPMKRMSATSEKRDDRLRVRDIVFKATFVDYGKALA